MGKVAGGPDETFRIGAEAYRIGQMARKSFESLAREARRARRGGIVTCDRRLQEAQPDARHAVDEYVRSLGFSAIGEQWIEIDRNRAEAILSHFLSHDMAYGTVLMPVERARKMAGDYLDLFGEDSASFFTNREGRAGTWTPISQATFDTGIVALDEEGIGILWVEDED